MFYPMNHIVQVFSLKANTDVKNKETSEKCSILPVQLNLFLLFNRGSSPRKVIILTADIQLVF
jgi:hypothetical protein